MARARFRNMFLIIPAVVFLLAFQTPVGAFMPFSRSPFFDMMVPGDDPFRILEQSPLAVPKGAESLALARTDWKETPTEHVILLDLPGIKKDDVTIEVEENRLLKISGERKGEGDTEGERWHRVERINGKFYRQFRFPINADLDRVNAHLQDGVLKITVPKLAEVEKWLSKVINIEDKGSSSGQDIKTVKAEI